MSGKNIKIFLLIVVVMMSFQRKKNEDYKYNYYVIRFFYGFFMEDINDVI